MKKASQKTKVCKVYVRNSMTPAKSSDVIRVKKRVQFAEVEGRDSSSSEQADFSLPEYCSILKLADEIKKVRLKPNSELVKREVEKIPKQFNVNFEPDEKIYQDLISIQRPIPELQPKIKSSHSSRFSTKKDPEPDYKELLKYTLQPEYNSARFIVPEVKKPVTEFDGRSIYRLTRKLTICNPY